MALGETNEEKLNRLRSSGLFQEYEKPAPTLMSVPEPSQQQRDLPQLPGVEDPAQLPGVEDPELQLNNSLRLGIGKDAGQAAEAERLGREHGVPAPAIEHNLDEARVESRINQVNVKKLIKEAPTTAQWLSNPDNSAQAQNDIERLSILERILRSPIPAGAVSGWDKHSKALLRQKEILGPGLTAAEKEEFDSLTLSQRLAQQEHGDDVFDFLDPGSYGFFMADQAGMIAGRAWNTLVDREFQAMAGVSVAGGLATAAVPAPGVAQLAGAGLASAGIATAFRAGLVEQTAYLLFDEAYSDLVDEYGFDRETATKGALIYTTMMTPQEVFGLRMLYKAFTGGGKDISRDFAMQTVLKGLKKRGGKEILKDRLKDIGKATAFNTIEEGVQKATVIALREYFQEEAGVAEDYTTEQFEADILAIGQEMAMAFKGSSGLAVTGGTVSGVREARQLGDATNIDQARIAEFSKAVAESELRKTNPAAFSELMKELGADSGTETVYLDPEALEALLQSDLVKPEIINGEETYFLEHGIGKLIVDKFSESADGSMIEIPIELFANEVAGQAVQPILRPYMKMDIDAMTPHQEHQSGVEEQIEMLNAIDKEKRTAGAEVYETVYRDLLEAGVPEVEADKDAVLHEAIFRTTADKITRSGRKVSAKELYDEQVGRIRREVRPHLRKQAESIQKFENLVERIRKGDLIQPVEEGQELTPEEQRQKEQLDRVSSILSDAGIDPEIMNNEEIREALEGMPESAIQQIVDERLDEDSAELAELVSQIKAEARDAFYALDVAINNQGEIEIEYIRVEEMRQGRGHATRALNALRKLGDEQGRDVVLETARDDLMDPRDGLIEFYSARGFNQEQLSMPGVMRYNNAQKLERAREQGFDTSRIWYHGRRSAPQDASFLEFEMDKALDGAHFFTKSESVAKFFGETDGTGQNRQAQGTHAYFINPGNSMVISNDELSDMLTDEQVDEGMLSRDLIAGIIEQAKTDGYDSLTITGFSDLEEEADAILPFNPEQIRLVDAVFDDPGSALIYSQDDLLNQTVPMKVAEDQLRDNFSLMVHQEPTSKIRVGIDKVHSLADAAHIAAAFRKHAQEVAIAIITDDEGNVLNIVRHSKGDKSSATLVPVVLAGAALSTDGATKMWVAHNHPTGRTKPSSADQRITVKIAEVMDGTSIQLAGHVVVGEGAKASRIDNDGSTHIDVVNITPAPRNKQVWLTERVIRTRSKLPAIDLQRDGSLTPQALANFSREHLSGGTTLLLMDIGFKPVGTMKLSLAEMSAMRENNMPDRLLRAFDQTNAENSVLLTADIANSDGRIGQPPASMQEAVANFAKFMNRQAINGGMSFIDWVRVSDRSYESSKMNQDGMASAQGNFYQTDIDEIKFWRDQVAKVFSGQRMDKKRPLQLGMPSEPLKDVGVPNVQIIMGSELPRVNKHSIGEMTWMGLLHQIKDPVAVFREQHGDETRVTILTQLTGIEPNTGSEKRPLVVVLEMNTPHQLLGQRVNMLVSFHHREWKTIKKWADDGLLLDMNKGKADRMADAAPIADLFTNAALDDVVVRNNIDEKLLQFDPEGWGQNQPVETKPLVKVDYSVPLRSPIGFISRAEQVVIDMRLPEWKKEGGSAKGSVILEKLKKEQVSNEELKWSGLQEMLGEIDFKLTRLQVQKYIRAQNIRMTEHLMTPDGLRTSVAYPQKWAELNAAYMEELRTYQDVTLPEYKASYDKWVKDKAEWEKARENQFSWTQYLVSRNDKIANPAPAEPAEPVNPGTVSDLASLDQYGFDAGRLPQAQLASDDGNVVINYDLDNHPAGDVIAELPMVVNLEAYDIVAADVENGYELHDQQLELLNELAMESYDQGETYAGPIDADERVQYLRDEYIDEVIHEAEHYLDEDDYRNFVIRAEVWGEEYDADDVAQKMWDWIDANGGDGESIFRSVMRARVQEEIEETNSESYWDEPLEFATHESLKRLADDTGELIDNYYTKNPDSDTWKIYVNGVEIYETQMDMADAMDRLVKGAAEAGLINLDLREDDPALGRRRPSSLSRVRSASAQRLIDEAAGLPVSPTAPAPPIPPEDSIEPTTRTKWENSSYRLKPLNMNPINYTERLLQFPELSKFKNNKSETHFPGQNNVVAFMRSDERSMSTGSAQEKLDHSVQVQNASSDLIFRVRHIEDDVKFEHRVLNESMVNSDSDQRAFIMRLWQPTSYDIVDEGLYWDISTRIDSDGERSANLYAYYKVDGDMTRDLLFTSYVRVDTALSDLQLARFNLSADDSIEEDNPAYFKDAIVATVLKAFGKDLSEQRLISDSLLGGETSNQWRFELPEDFDIQTDSLDESVIFRSKITRDISSKVRARTFYLDELQSDWHRAGLNYGYKIGQTIDEDALRLEAVEKKAAVIEMLEEMDDVKYETLIQIYRDAGLTQEIERAVVIERTVEELITVERPDAIQKVLIKTIKIINPEALRIIGEVSKIRSDLSVDSSKSVPDVPGKQGKWVKIALRRALILAAEGDFDGFAFPNSGTHIRRTNPSLLKMFKVLYDNQMTAAIKELTGEKPVLISIDTEEIVDNPINIEQYEKKWNKRLDEIRALPLETLLHFEDINATIQAVSVSQGQVRYKAVRTTDKGMPGDPEIIYDGPNTVQLLNAFGMKPPGDMESVAAYYWVKLTPELKKEILDNGTNLLQDDDTVQEGQRPRGYFEPATRRITLTERANATTFLHESGHLFLEMYRDLAQESEEIAADLQTVYSWAGAEGSWKDMTIEQRRQVHEKFASGFESWLMEGKAPTAELQPIFSQFKAWFLDVYKSLTEVFRRNHFAGTELSDEMREVFRRLVATDEELKRATSDQGLIALPIEQMGLKPGDAEAYLKAVEDAKLESDQQLTEKVMRDIRRQRKAWWKLELKKTASVIEEELNDSKENVARDFMSGKRMVEGIEQFKLDTDAVARLYGVDVASALSRMRVLKKGAMHPDAVATKLGFATGEELVLGLQSSTSKKERANIAVSQAQEKMDEKYGDLMSAGSLYEEAKIVVHNDMQGKRLLLELRLLNQKIGSKAATRSVPQVTLALYKEAARRAVENMSIKEIQPHKYLRAERRWAREATKLAAQGKYQEALEAKHRQLRQFYMYQQGHRIKERGEKHHRRLQQMKLGKYNAKRVDPEYIQQLKVLLSVYDLRKRPTNRDTQGRIASVQKFLAAQEESNPGLIATAYIDNIQDWRNLTILDLQSLRNAAENMLKIGKEKSEEGYKDLTMQAILAKNAIEASSQIRARPLGQDDETSLEKGRSITQRFSEDQVMLYTNIRKFDSYEFGGVWYRNILEPISRGTETRTRMNMEASESLNDILKPFRGSKLKRSWLKNRQAEKQADTVGEFQHLDESMVKRTLNNGGSWTLSAGQRVMLAVYWGSPESRKAIVDSGYQGQEVTELDVQVMLDLLTDEQVELVKKIWSFNEQYWSELARINKELTGLAPLKVDHMPFRAGNHELEGGYQRIYYHWTPKDGQKLDMHDEASNAMNVKNGVTQTKTGASIQRKGSGGRQIRLETDNIMRATDEIINFIAYAEISRDVGRFLNHPMVAKSIIDVYGKEKYQSFFDSVDGIFAGNVEGGAPINTMMRMVRTNLSIAYLTFSIRNMIQQPLAITNSLGRNGELATLGAMSTLAMRPIETIKWIHSKSYFMQERNKLVNREVAEQLAVLENSAGKGFIKQRMFVLQVVGDAVAVYPAWLAAYRRGLIEVAEFGMTEAEISDKAAKFADLEAEAMIGSGRKQGLAPIFQGSGNIARTVGIEASKQFTFMGTFFGVNYNLYGDAWSRMRKGKISKAKYTREMMWYLVIPAIWAKLLTEQLPDPDDDEGWTKWMVAGVAEFGMSASMFWRNIASAQKGFEPNIPAFSAFTGLVRLGGEAAELLNEEEELGMDDMASVIRAMQPLLPMPASGQVARSLEQLESVERGSEDASLYNALVKGKKR